MLDDFQLVHLVRAEQQGAPEERLTAVKEDDVGVVIVVLVERDAAQRSRPTIVGSLVQRAARTSGAGT